MQKEMGGLKKTALEDAEREKQKIIQDAEILAGKLEEHLDVQISQKILKAKAEIRILLAEETIKIAEKSLKRSVNAKRQEALIQDYTQLIKEAK